MAKAKKGQLPQTLFACIVGEGKFKYIYTVEDYKKFDNDQANKPIGIYELVETRELIIDKELN